MTTLLMHQAPSPTPEPGGSEPPFRPAHDHLADWLDTLSRASVRVLSAGEHWDAVKITGSAAPLVHGLMHQQACGNTGPVVIDAGADAHYWLIRTGYPADWTFPGVRLLTRGTWVVLPPTVRTVHRVHWLNRPRADGGLVHAPLLHATIATAVAG